MNHAPSRCSARGSIGVHLCSSAAPLLLSLSLALLASAPPARADLSCPGDLNGDRTVSIDELVRAVNAALQGCGPAPDQVSPLAQTGQTQCDQGDGTLGACPGSPPGQDAAVRAGRALGYTDNGDGTIRDNVTGLVWEKLSDDGSVHDYDNTYTWYDAFAVKVAELNTPPCFAGHCDWRLPNRRELESLVDAGRSAPALAPAFNAGCEPDCTPETCACAQSAEHDYDWASTTYHDLPGLAWAVNFNVGDVSAFEKTIGTQCGVRAVRGGL